ncbi:hypothetical protein BsWGS_09038 [Bradybaena similaris]
MSWTPANLCCNLPTGFAFLVVACIAFYLIVIPQLDICGARNKVTNFDRTAKKQILLVSYGRSGSAFTSALISRHGDIFFVPEPLYTLKLTSLRNYNEKDSVAIMKTLFTCEFTAQYTFALDNVQFRLSESTQEFYECIINSRVNGTAHVVCFLQLLEACRRHQATLIKTIRFQVKWAESLLAGNPNFRLLFLVRDPRGTLFSQTRVFESFNYYSTQMYNFSKEYCNGLALDLHDAQRLHKLYPGQVKGIRYEEGAMNAVLYTKVIYNFLGLFFDEALVDYIANITSASLDDPRWRDIYGVIRRNSRQTMDLWRVNATFSTVQDIDKSCAHLYPKLGYQPIVSKTHLHSDKSLVLDPKPGGIF